MGKQMTPPEAIDKLVMVTKMLKAHQIMKESAAAAWLDRSN